MRLSCERVALTGAAGGGVRPEEPLHHTFIPAKAGSIPPYGSPATSMLILSGDLPGPRCGKALILRNHRKAQSTALMPRSMRDIRMDDQSNAGNGRRRNSAGACRTRSNGAASTCSASANTSDAAYWRAGPEERQGLRTNALKDRAVASRGGRRTDRAALPAPRRERADVTLPVLTGTAAIVRASTRQPDHDETLRSSVTVRRRRGAAY